MLTEQGEQAAQQRQTDNGEQVAGGCPLATMDNYKKLVLTLCRRCAMLALSDNGNGYTVTHHTTRTAYRRKSQPAEKDGTNMNTTTTETRKNFETVKRNFETAFSSGRDYSAELLDLSTAVAYSVLNKCLDPQRKTAVDREQVSDNGQNPALLAVKRGIAQDRRTLDSTKTLADRSTRITFNTDGDAVTVTADKEADKALGVVLRERLTDGIDLVQEAAAAILEQAAEHADPAAPWLDSKYTVRRLSRRVYIQAEDSAAYADAETTPIQEVYRAVRKAVQDSRATQTDPRNGYTYLEELTPDGLETIYRRLSKFADLGGYDCNGLYNTDAQTVADYDALVEKLELTDRQAVIVRLRMQGKGNKAIATYLGVTYQAVQNTLAKIQRKAAKIGLTPAGYVPQDGQDD